MDYFPIYDANVDGATKQMFGVDGVAKQTFEINGTAKEASEIVGASVLKLLGVSEAVEDH